MGDDLPQEIQSLIEQCEANVKSFSNDQMSMALKYGQLMHARILRLAEYNERMSAHFPAGDVRGPMMSDAAKDIREVMGRCEKDL